MATVYFAGNLGRYNMRYGPDPDIPFAQPRRWNSGVPALLPKRMGAGLIGVPYRHFRQLSGTREEITNAVIQWRIRRS